MPRPERMRHLPLFVLAIAGIAGAATVDAVVAPQQAPPFPIGAFEDDYGGRHTVSATEWQQGSSARYRIVRWDSAQRFLVAQNGEGNPSSPGRWTRIDWILLDGMPPYTWAFCFSAYDAPTADSAAATRIARPETPRTGCNGFPYSRLKPLSR
jgi:hypothetical protein